MPNDTLLADTVPGDYGTAFDSSPLWEPGPSLPVNRGVGGTVASSLKRGVDQLQATGFGLAAVIADTFGADEFAKSFLRGYTRNMAEASENPAEVGTFRNIEDAGTLGTYITEAVFENLPNMAASMAGGGVGALAAKGAVARAVGERMVGADVAKRFLASKAGQAAAANASVTGATIGSFAANVGQETGSIAGDIYERTGELKPVQSFLGGVAAGAVETIGDTKLIKQVFGEAAAGQVTKNLARRLGEAGAVQFLKEGGTEAIQTVIEETAAWHAENQPDKPFWTPQMVDSIVDAALKGGFAGAAFGVGGQVWEEARRKEQVKDLRDAADKNEQLGNIRTAGVLRQQADEIELQPMTVEELKGADAPLTPAGATTITPRVRGEAAMETRSPAALGLKREPEVSPELADAIAAVRGKYNPEIDAPAAPAGQPSTFNLQPSTPSASPPPPAAPVKINPYFERVAGDAAIPLEARKAAWRLAKGQGTSEDLQAVNSALASIPRLAATAQEGPFVKPEPAAPAPNLDPNPALQTLSPTPSAPTTATRGPTGAPAPVADVPRAGETLPAAEKIVAATVQPERGGKVFEAPVHALAFVEMQKEFPGIEPEAVIAGFKTNTGRIVSREEAARISGIRQRLAASENITLSPPPAATPPAPTEAAPAPVAVPSAQPAPQPAVATPATELVEDDVVDATLPDLEVTAQGLTPAERVELNELRFIKENRGGKLGRLNSERLAELEAKAGSEINTPPASAPLQTLRDNVTGAIERGEKQAIVEQPATPSTTKLDDIKRRRAEIAAKMAAKARQLSAGLDPEYLTLTAQLVETYVEEGVLRFADFARKVRADFPELWDKTKGYLRGAWNAVADQDNRIAEVSKEQSLGDITAAETVDTTPPVAEPASDPIRDILLSSDTPQKKASQIRKLADERGLTVKQMQETIEAEIVKLTNEIASDPNTSADEQFRQLVDLYERQPTLSARTSTSIANQAYSTPAPLAFALGWATLTNTDTSVYDPTGGTGMLFIGANLPQSVANELNPERAEFLRRLGIGTVTENDATKFVPDGKVESVHTNPPFGTIPVVNYDGYGIKKLEHLIALKSLEAMQNNGTAMIVLGANMMEGDTKRGAQWVFENYLYGRYHVADNFEVNGDLYGKQGAKWPVRVLVVAGRRQSPLTGELAPQRVDRLATWDDVWARAQKARDEVKRIRSGLGTAEPAGLPSGVPEGGIPGEATGNVPAGSGAAAAPANPRGKRPRTGGGGAAAGPVAGGSPAVAAQPESPGVSGPAAAEPGPAGVATGGLESGGIPSLATTPDASGNSLAGSGTTQPRIVSQPGAVTGQIAYQPRSGATTLETLTPANIGPGTHAALDELVERVGPVDEFVSERLQMPVEELRQVLAAEQVDTVALAIDQIENGGALIVGSETGIGKGRMAAALIRYAILNGKIPVFFTKDPKLFSDMFGDLKDIHTEVKPLIFGDPNKARIVDTDGNVLVNAPTGPKQKRIMREVQADGMEKAGFNAIFSTYSQVNQENDRQRFLEWLAGNQDVVLVLDEAHEAAGDAESSMQAAFFSGGDVERGKGRDRVTIHKAGLLNAAGTKRGRGGVLYLSATFAKRPENMPLYFRTALSMATQSFNDLVDAMKAGGVAMQQAISEALAGVGQYVRHERDFSGVKYQTKLVEEVDKDKLIEQVDDTTDVLRAIVDFSKRVIAAVEHGAGGGRATAMGEDAMSMTDFASIAHNQIGQLLLAAKADTVVQEAIAARSRGEKPIIALMNTMESFLSQFVESQGINPGDAITLRWNELLKFALDRTLRMQIKHPNGDTEVVQLSPADLELQAQYDRVLAMADALDIALPVSPIDYIIQKLEAAGIKMGEMTGRESGILYDNPEQGVGTYRHFSKANKNSLVNAFNNGQLDGLLLNASGSTGLSLHAARKFRDQSKRHMVIAQPALDINVFVQTLGRIKRTGMLPGSAEYTHLVLPLQAELRPAAVTSKKMKSLSANTTAESQGAVKIQTDDFLNKYGDGIVAEYLENNPDLQEITGLFVNRNDSGGMEYPQDLARKLTGRMALMPDAVQEAAYQEIIPAYRQLIERLKATGEYDLDIVVHDDWDAVRTSDTELSPGTDESNLFTASTRAQEWEITDERHVPTGDEMQREFQENTGGWSEIEGKWGRFNTEVNQRLQILTDSAQAEFDAARALPDGDTKPGKVAAAEKKLQSARQMSQRWQNTRGFLAQTLRLARNGAINIEESETQDSRDGALVNFKFPDLGKGLRVSPSAFQFTFLTNNPGGRLHLNGAELNGKFTIAESSKSFSDFTGKRAGQRYTRWVVTGNPIAAYRNTGRTGKVVRFKSRDGDVVTGLLMPNSWDISRLVVDPRVEFINGMAVESFLRNAPYHSSISAQLGDGAEARIQPSRGRFVVSMPSSRRGGNALYLNGRLLEITGEFTRSGSRMIAEIRPEQIGEVADVVSDIVGKRWRASEANGDTIAQVGAANDSARGSRLDSAINALDRLDRRLSDNQYSDPFLLTPLAKLALKLAKALLQAGRTLEVAIREAIAQAKAQMPEDTTDADQLQAALTDAILADAPDAPAPVQSAGESKPSRALEEFTPETMYRTETEQGRNEAARQFIDRTHGGDIEAAFGAIASPSTTSGIPDSLRIIIAKEIAVRATKAAMDGNDAAMFDLADKALVIAKQTASETGQALQATNQAIKEMAAEDAVVNFWKANNGLIDRLLSAKFPDVTSSRIKAWLQASGREAVKAVAEQMKRTNNVTDRVLRIVGRDADVDWASLFTSSAANQRQWQRDLFAKIREHPKLRNLSEQESAELTNLLSEAWQRERMKVFRREFRKNVVLPEVKPSDATRLESAIPELVKQLNLGLLDNEAFRNAVAPRYGQKPVTMADARELFDKAQAAQAKPEGFQRTRAFRDVYDEMRKRSGIKAWEYLQSWWYASVLSGFGTQGRNILGNASILAENLIASVARNPRAAGALMGGMLRGMRENITQGEFKAIMSGDVTARPGMDIKDAANVLELAKDSPDKWKRLLSNGRYVTRFMLAADSFFYDASAEVAAINEIVAQNKTASWPEVEKAIFEKLNQSPEKRAAAEAKAKAEGLTGTDLDRRVVEILEQQRPSEILDAQHRFALEATLNNEPQGLLGMIAKVLITARDKVPPLVAIVPFVRISANVGNLLLQHSPFGLYYVLRNWRTTGNAEWTRQAIGIREDLTPEEYQQLRAKVLLSHAALMGVLAWAMSGADDDEPWFQVTGSMNGIDPDKRRQLEQQGIRPYSLKFGNRSFDYRQTPWATGFAYVGQVMDAKRYDPKWNEQIMAVKFATALAGGKAVILDQNFLSNLMVLLERGPQMAKDQNANKYLAFLGRTAGGSVPTVAKEVDSWFAPEITKPMEAWDYIQREFPIARRYSGTPVVNVLGDPVERPRYPWSWLTSEASDDPVWQALGEKAQRGVFLPVPSAAATVLKDGKRVKMTPDQFARYQAEVGKLYRAKLARDLARFERMTPEQAAEYFKREFEPLREQARTKIR